MDDDIYGDLPEFEYDKEFEKLENEVKDLQQKLIELNKKIDKLTEEKTTLIKKNRILLKNVSILLKTARQEIRRKDTTIVELRKQLGDYRGEKQSDYRKVPQNEEKNLPKLSDVHDLELRKVHTENISLKREEGLSRVNNKTKTITEENTTKLNSDKRHDIDNQTKKTSTSSRPQELHPELTELVCEGKDLRGQFIDLKNRGHSTFSDRHNPKQSHKSEVWNRLGKRKDLWQENERRPSGSDYDRRRYQDEWEEEEMRPSRRRRYEEGNHRKRNRRSFDGGRWNSNYQPYSRFRNKSRSRSPHQRDFRYRSRSRSPMQGPRRSKSNSPGRENFSRSRSPVQPSVSHKVENEYARPQSPGMIQTTEMSSRTGKRELTSSEQQSEVIEYVKKPEDDVVESSKSLEDNEGKKILPKIKQPTDGYLSPGLSDPYLTSYEDGDDREDGEMSDSDEYEDAAESTNTDWRLSFRNRRPRRAPVKTLFSMRMEQKLKREAEQKNSEDTTGCNIQEKENSQKEDTSVAKIFPKVQVQEGCSNPPTVSNIEQKSSTQSCNDEKLEAITAEKGQQASLEGRHVEDGKEVENSSKAQTLEIPTKEKCLTEEIPFLSSVPSILSSIVTYSPFKQGYKLIQLSPVPKKTNGSLSEFHLGAKVEEKVNTEIKQNDTTELVPQVSTFSIKMPSKPLLPTDIISSVPTGIDNETNTFTYENTVPAQAKCETQDNLDTVSNKGKIKLAKPRGSLTAVNDTFVQQNSQCKKEDEGFDIKLYKIPKKKTGTSDNHSDGEVKLLNRKSPVKSLSTRERRENFSTNVQHHKRKLTTSPQASILKKSRSSSLKINEVPRVTKTDTKEGESKETSVGKSKRLSPKKDKKDFSRNKVTTPGGNSKSPQTLKEEKEKLQKDVKETQKIDAAEGPRHYKKEKAKPLKTDSTIKEEKTDDEQAKPSSAAPSSKYADDANPQKMCASTQVKSHGAGREPQQVELEPSEENKNCDIANFKIFKSISTSQTNQAISSEIQCSNRLQNDLHLTDSEAESDSEPDSYDSSGSGSDSGASDIMDLF